MPPAKQQPYRVTFGELSQEETDLAGMGTMEAQQEYGMGKLEERAKWAGRDLELRERGQKFQEKTMGERGERYAKGIKAGAEREEAGRQFKKEEAQTYRSWVGEQRAEMNQLENLRLDEFEKQIADSATPRGWSNFIQLAGTVIGAAYGNAGLGSTLGGAVAKAATGYAPSTGARAVSSIAGSVVGGARASEAGRALDVEAHQRGLRTQAGVDVVDPRTRFRPVPTAQPGMSPGYEVVPYGSPTYDRAGGAQ